MNYKLELFGKGKPAIALLEKRGRGLTDRLRHTRILFDNDAAGWKELLLHDLDNLRSWNILQVIDGYASYSQEDRQPLRDKARRYLNKAGIQEALTIAINSALLLFEGPKGDKTPGYSMGHSLMFRELTDPNSTFYGLLDEKMIKRLNNGRFWESLPNLHFNIATDAYKTLENLLMNHSEDLDVNFAPKGIDILHRGEVFEPKFSLCGMQRGGCGPEDVMGLSLPAIDRYVLFIRIIDSQLRKLGIPKERFAPLVKAYISLLEENDEWGNIYFGDAELRRQDPLVKKYSKK